MGEMMLIQSSLSRLPTNLHLFYTCLSGRLEKIEKGYKEKMYHLVDWAVMVCQDKRKLYLLSLLVHEQSVSWLVVLEVLIEMEQSFEMDDFGLV